MTPLHDAVEWQFCKEDQVVKILLERGANKTVVDHRGMTPLAIAHGRKALSIGREKRKRNIIKALTD